MKFIQTILITFVLAFASIAAQAEPVNINKASAAQLTKNLKGIGPKKANAIVLYRKKNGPFKKHSDLLKVKGIGEKTIAANKKNIRLKAKK